MSKKLLLSVLFFAVLLSLESQNRTKAFLINAELGRGINYGNMFEAPTETAWGNQWQPEYPEIISSLGFGHVRMPIRWETAERSLSTAPYTIESTFLERIKLVIDANIQNGLYTIINMHHHEALFNDPDGEKERFLVQWKQISEFFKDYPDSVVFEILNEPQGNLSPSKWNTFIIDALAKIREDNPDRVVLIGTAEFGGLSGLPALEVPNDDNVILTIHYYNPFPFTHQGASWVAGADTWLGTTWDDTESERNIIRQDFAPLIELSERENIPVHIGEFGAFSTADIVSRSKWTTFLSRYFEEQNWSWAYWEFSAGFGIYEPSTQTYVQELRDALLINEIPEAGSYVGNVIYSSDFEINNDGWFLNTLSGATGTLERENDALQVNITNGSVESWHVQLLKTNISLEQGKKYRLSFKAKSDAPRAIASYVGMNAAPWSSYGGAITPTLSDTFLEYSFIFDMSVSDNQARIGFDLGISNTNVAIKEVVLEELELAALSITDINKIDSKVFPNPLNRILNIHNYDNFTELAIYNIQGQLIKTKSLSEKIDYVDLQYLKPGIYVVSLKGDRIVTSLKMIKQ